MNDKYAREIDPAQKLFWDKMMEDMKHTTKTKIYQALEEIKQNTNDVPWLSKFIGNMFKFGGSQAEQKYPGKKKS